LNWG